MIYTKKQAAQNLSLDFEKHCLDYSRRGFYSDEVLKGGAFQNEENLFIWSNINSSYLCHIPYGFGTWGRFRFK